MLKNSNKVIIILLTVTIFFGFTLTVTASSFHSGNLNENEVHAFVEVTDSGAFAQTTISADPQLSSSIVSLTYSYINTKTNKITTMKEIGIGSNIANIHLQKPKQSHYVSLEARATHTVRYSGQEWFAYTNDHTPLFSFVNKPTPLSLGESIYGQTIFSSFNINQY